MDPDALAKLIANPGIGERAMRDAKLSFGPVIERVVTNMIDFDTGALIDFPMATQPDEADDARYGWINGQNVPDGKVPNKESYPWMRAHGVDAVEGNHDLINLSLMLVARLVDKDWDTLTPTGEKKLRALALPGAATATFNGPGTYGFKTREGSLGLVQIIDQHLPRGVKLRYKLAAAPRTASFFGPVIERELSANRDLVQFFPRSQYRQGLERAAGTPRFTARERLSQLWGAASLCGSRVDAVERCRCDGEGRIWRPAFRHRSGSGGWCQRNGRRETAAIR